MRKLYISTLLASMLAGCAGTNTPKLQQSPHAFNSKATNTYRIEQRKIDEKQVLYIQKPGDNSLYRVFETRGSLKQVKISASGEYITYISLERSTPAVFIQETATGKRVSVCTLADPDIETSISADSSKLIIMSKGKNYNLQLAEPSLLNLTLPRDSLPFCSAPPGPAKVVTYLFNFFRGKDALAQALLRETSGEPELRHIAQESLAYFDIEALAWEFSKSLSQVLTPHEIEQCLAFIESKDGAALMSASQQAASSSELPRLLELLPAQEKTAVLGFFNSNCTKKTIEYIGSQEARGVSRNYGKGLMCSYAENTSVEMLRVLKDHGECQAQQALR